MKTSLAKVGLVNVLPLNMTVCKAPRPSYWKLNPTAAKACSNSSPSSVHSMICSMHSWYMLSPEPSIVKSKKELDFREKNFCLPDLDGQRDLSGQRASAMIREGHDYQAVLPDHGAPMLPDTEDVAGVRDDPHVWDRTFPVMSGRKELARSYCHIKIGTFVLVHERGWGIIVPGDRHKGWTVEFMDDTTRLYPCNDDDDTPTEFEAYRTFNKWGERYYWTRHEVRKEFAPWRKEHGEIHFSPTVHDDPTRIEFSKGHEKHGEAHCFDSQSQLTRIEFLKGHKMDGDIHFFDGGKPTHSEYRLEDGRLKSTLYYDGHWKNVTRVEFGEGHWIRHGEIHYYDGCFDKLIRVEYAEHHKLHGEIRYYDGNFDKLTRVEYSKDHEKHGEIHYFNGSFYKLTRIEYSEGHELHGQVRHFENNKLTRIIFKDNITQYYDGVDWLIRAECGKGHPKDGQIQFYADGSPDKLIRVEFPSSRHRPVYGSREHTSISSHLRNLRGCRPRMAQSGQEWSKHAQNGPK